MVNIELLQDKLRDARSKKVIFVSHCILNENTRYLGGAFRKDFLYEVIEQIHKNEAGIFQMPCPEQLAWGGVLKKLIWLPVNTKGSLLYYFAMLMYPAFMFLTYFNYSIIASKIMRIIKDYIKSGFTVVGIIGIDGSPTCGVNKKLDMRKSFKYYSSLKTDKLSRKKFNLNLFKNCLANGKGIFIKILSQKLIRNNIKIKFLSIDLQKEMSEKKISVEF